MANPFFINEDVESRERFDMARFMEYVEDAEGYDILASFFIEIINKIRIDGYFNVTVEAQRPDTVSWKIFRNHQYWWQLLEKNRLTSYKDLVTEQRLEYLSLRDLENVYFDLRTRQKAIETAITGTTTGSTDTGGDTPSTSTGTLLYFGSSAPEQTKNVLWVHTNRRVPFVYDIGRQKWLGTERKYWAVNKNNHQVSNQYLYRGIMPNNIIAFKNDFPITLTRAVVQKDTGASFTIEFRDDGGALIDSVDAQNNYEVKTDLNLDRDAGEALKIYLNGGPVGFPFIRLEYRERVE
jgi:hypothetical protein